MRPRGALAASARLESTERFPALRVGLVIDTREPSLSIRAFNSSSERFLTGCAPRWMPLVARRTFSHEMVATVFFALALSTIEGGVVSVFARQTFDHEVSQGRLNFAVAALGAMNELANILSFVWSVMSTGRRIVPFINALQVAVIVLIALVALLPGSASGLYLLVALVLAARLCWSGMITMRTNVWRSNYPPATRARIVGMVSSAQMLIVAAGGAGLGYVLDRHPQAFRLMLPVACVLAIIAVWSYGRIRVRHEYRLLKPPAPGHGVMKPWHGPLVVWRVLRRDKRYAQFMLCMFVLGFGNLMVNPILVIMLREQFGFRYFQSILITSSIQAVVQVAIIPLWARLLDRAHVVRFRSVHSWVFVVGAMMFTLAAMLHRVEFLFIGAVVQGCAYAGGALAWNLGHVDFSPPSETSNYMATHVTLNGVRGLVAPLVSVSIFEALKAAGLPAPTFLLLMSVCVNAAGAAGFVALRISMASEMSRVSRNG
jgi:MFS family permease